VECYKSSRKEKNEENLRSIIGDAESILDGGGTFEMMMVDAEDIRNRINHVLENLALDKKANTSKYLDLVELARRDEALRARLIWYCKEKVVEIIEFDLCSNNLICNMTRFTASIHRGLKRALKDNARIETVKVGDYYG
jgi:hypothetical protein